MVKAAKALCGARLHVVVNIVVEEILGTRGVLDRQKIYYVSRFCFFFTPFSINLVEVRIEILVQILDRLGLALAAVVASTTATAAASSSGTTTTAGAANPVGK